MNRQRQPLRFGDRIEGANRLGEDYSVDLRPWSFEIRHQMRAEFRIEVHDRASVDRAATATAIGLAVLRAMERCSQ